MRDDMFCTAGYLGNSGVCHAPAGLAQPNCAGCRCYKHKWPTPAQFEKEYGKKPTDGFPAWWFLKKNKKNEWDYCTVFMAKYCKDDVEACVIICTPYGRPPADYRPEETE